MNTLTVMNNNTLLALLLGLHHLDGELTVETKSSFKRLVGLFQMDDDWEDIQKQLDSLLEKNTVFKQGYQTAKESLKAVDSDILADLLPNQNEINQLMPYTGERGYTPGDPNDKNHEILNISIVIASHEKPVETAKKLLQPIDDYLKRKPEPKNQS